MTFITINYKIQIPKYIFCPSNTWLFARIENLNSESKTVFSGGMCTAVSDPEALRGATPRIQFLRKKAKLKTKDLPICSRQILQTGACDWMDLPKRDRNYISKINRYHFEFDLRDRKNYEWFLAHWTLLFNNDWPAYLLLFYPKYPGIPEKGNTFIVVS